MLTYFPTPYPGEWWYSVLCRYHVRTGNEKMQTTVRELFGDKEQASMGAVFPNAGILRVLDRLPRNLFSIREIILQHTLFPYYTRFHNLETKKDMLRRLSTGETFVITCVRRFAERAKWQPRYCPVCVQEDRKSYGEAYWHITHQIPMMEVCPVHGCKLAASPEVQASHMSYTFYPLDDVDAVAPEYPPLKSWQRTMSQILSDYQTLPIEAGATDGYSNLAIAVGNMGYEALQKHSPHTILEAKKVYSDMAEFYGRELVERIFGPRENTYTINKTCKWGMQVPERYAMLQCFAGLDTKIMFSSERLQNRYEEQLLQYQESGKRYGRKQLAKALGIRPSRLDVLTEKYGIQPAWTRNGSEIGEEDFQKVAVRFTETEYAAFKQAMGNSDYRYNSHFAKHCIMAYIQEHCTDGSN